MTETPEQTLSRLLALLQLVEDDVHSVRTQVLWLGADDPSYCFAAQLIDSAHGRLTEARELMAAKMTGAW